MLQSLTDRERRTLLAILAILAIGAVVKLWRWKSQQTSEPINAAEPGENIRVEPVVPPFVEVAFVP